MMAVLDVAHFDHMTGGDRALQLEILMLFRSQADGWKAALAVEDGWRGAVHTLKGSARGIGFHDLAQACESADAATDADRGMALARLAAALAEALAALEQFAAPEV